MSEKIFVLEASLIGNCEKCKAPTVGTYKSKSQDLLTLTCIACNHKVDYEVSNDLEGLKFERIK